MTVHSIHLEKKEKKGVWKTKKRKKGGFSSKKGKKENKGIKRKKEEKRGVLDTLVAGGATGDRARL